MLEYQLILGGTDLCDLSEGATVTITVKTMDANDEEIDFDDICKLESYADCNNFSISDQPAGNK